MHVAEIFHSLVGDVEADKGVRSVQHWQLLRQSIHQDAVVVDSGSIYRFVKIADTLVCEIFDRRYDCKHYEATLIVIAVMMILLVNPFEDSVYLLEDGALSGVEIEGFIHLVTRLLLFYLLQHDFFVGFFMFGSQAVFAAQADLNELFAQPLVVLSLILDHGRLCVSCRLLHH